MKQYLKAFLISILSHLIIIILLYTKNEKFTQQTHYIKFNIISQESGKNIVNSAPLIKTNPPHKHPNNSYKTESSFMSKSMKAILDYKTVAHKIDEAAIDTSQYLITSNNKIFTDPHVHFNQYIKNKLKEDYPDAFPSRDEKSQKKQINPQFNYICDKIDAQALDFLYKKNKGTQIETYTSFDLNDSVTASLLDARLEKLVKMGLLTRKKISPQLPFTISAFFVQIPIEMSKKNRNNPLYEYQPLISRRNLIIYLQTKLYRLKEKLNKSTADRSKLKKDIKTIQESLMILTRG